MSAANPLKSNMTSIRELLESNNIFRNIHYVFITLLEIKITETSTWTLYSHLLKCGTSNLILVHTINITLITYIDYTLLVSNQACLII